LGLSSPICSSLSFFSCLLITNFDVYGLFHSSAVFTLSD
jgi:hypothetical protein